MDEELCKKGQQFLTEVVMAMNYNFIFNKKYLKDIECIICCESMKNSYVITTPCKHTYHRSCLIQCMVDYDYDQCVECESNFKFIKQELKVEQKQESNSLLDQAEGLIAELEEINDDFNFDDI